VRPPTSQKAELLLQTLIGLPQNRLPGGFVVLTLVNFYDNIYERRLKTKEDMRDKQRQAGSLPGPSGGVLEALGEETG
jgi:hypothetical protein